MERVSTCGLTQSLIASTLAMQSRMAEAQVQSSSGLLATTYAGLGADSGALIALETELTRMDTWSSNTETALSRVQSMYDAVGSMTDVMTSLRATISAALSDTTGAGDYAATAQGLMEEFASLLNTQLDGRYLFSGGDATDPAVPSEYSGYPVQTVPSTANTGYYMGDDSIASVRVSEERTVEYGVTADNGAFEEAIRALSLVANATSTPLDTATFEEAYDLALGALNDLTAVQSGLSLKAEQLERAQHTQETTKSLVEGSITDLKSSDTAEVSVRLAEYETLLQASYSALASATSLTLVDYL